MARIRSIHPGLWTDETFVGLTLAARLFFIGIWNEADDRGAFEWKPITLKMRVMPADNVDANAIMEELAEKGCVTRYAIEGKSYGLVRNFTKFQRPKKPTYIHPVPDEGGSGSPPVPHQFPTPSEIPPQMEEEGGRRESSSEPKGSGTPDGAPVDPFEIPLTMVRPPNGDWSVALFRQGLGWLARTTERPPNAIRPVLGKWLKATGNDHHAVFELLAQAQRDAIAEPIAWITRCLEAPEEIDWKAELEKVQ